MKRHGILSRIAVLGIDSIMMSDSYVTVARSDETQNTPYNINFSIGTNASQVRFNWFSSENKTPEVQIAKASDVQGVNFPSNSAVSGSVSPVTATISIEDHPGNPNQQTTDSVTGKNEYANRVTVNGLAPSTKYIYRVGDGTTWSDTYTFTTGNPGSGFSFAAFGDPQIGAFDSNKKSSEPHANLTDDQKGWGNTLNEVIAKDPSINFLLSLGDQVNNYDDIVKQQNEYKAFFNPDPAQNYLQKFPLIAFEGNHDHQMGTYYSFHYNQPNLSILGQTSNSSVDNNDGDYWFTYGNVLFIMLNANNAYDTAAHDQFMQQAVSANPNVKWKVAAWHQSAYSEANHSDSNSADDPIMFIRQNWTKLMDKYGIDVALQGHDHEYTRTYQMYGGVPVNTTKTNSVTNPKGTVYFTLDSGSGSKYYDFKSTSDHTFSDIFWQQYVPTYSYITFNDSQFSINTYRNDTGASIDNYTIKKVANDSSKTPTPPTGTSQTPTGTSQTSGTNSTTTTQNPKTGDNSVSESGMIAMVAVSGIIILIAAIVIVEKKKKVKAQ